MNIFRFTSTPERRNENINLNEYFNSSSGDRTHNQWRLQSHFEPMRHDWPEKNKDIKRLIDTGCYSDKM